MCSSCGLTIPDDARFCSWCGGPNEVVVPVAAVAPTVAPVQPVMPVRTVATPIATVPVTPTVPAKSLAAAPVITPPDSRDSSDSGADKYTGSHPSN